MKKDAKNPKLAEYVRARRAELGLSLEECERISHLDYSYWSKLENGWYAQPSPQYLHNIAHALDVPFEDLFALAGYDSPKRLPSFTPYLRAKYDLPPQAIRDLEKYFTLLRNYYGIPKDAPVFPPKPPMVDKPSPYDPPQELIDEMEGVS